MKKRLGTNFKQNKIFNLLFQNIQSEYAMDASFKLELIEEILAKEMHVGRFYLKREMDTSD